ncbi:Uncharacterised protein [Vibrio cholerae]|nr:Uncharacterised protein [Vibrio cholerae]
MHFCTLASVKTGEIPPKWRRLEYPSAHDELRRKP